MYAVMGGLDVIKADYPGRPSTSWLAGWLAGELSGLVSFTRVLCFLKPHIKKYYT